MRFAAFWWLVVLGGACGGDPGGADGGGSGGGGDGGTHPHDGGGSGGAPDSTPGGPNGCLARDCGPDGAGGSCGACGGTFTCDNDLGLCIPPGTDPTVTFGSACWFVCPTPPPQGFGCTAGQRFQAITFDLQQSFPIEATLYFDDTCNPQDGTDNLNDTGAATPTQIGEEWFIHHPDTKPSSAVWWFGTHSTGCLDYTNAPDCQ